MKISPIILFQTNSNLANKKKVSQPNFGAALNMINYGNKLIREMNKSRFAANDILSNLIPKLEIKSGQYSKIIIEKIEATKGRIRVLQEAIATGVKPVKVRNAEDDIKFYANFNQSSEYLYYDKIATREAKAAEAKQNWFGRTFNSVYDDVYNEKMSPYYRKKERHDRILYTIKDLKNIVADYETSKRQQNEILLSLKRELAAYEAQLTSAGLTDVIARTLKSDGGIEDRIAGYYAVKDKIIRDFVGPLMQSKTLDKGDLSITPVPAAIVLYGATGVGKTEMLRAIEEQCSEVANVVHFDPSITIKNFQSATKQYLQRAIQEHGDTQKRTILLIDEAEKYLCMTVDKAKKFVTGLENDDFDILTKYGSDGKDNVDYLKTVLDRVSELPADNDPTKCATTIFITTNYPHLIDQDLMRRKGKFTPIAVPPAKDDDLVAVLKHYFKLNSTTLELIKRIAKNDNFLEVLNGQINLSQKAKEVFIEKRNNGSLDTMCINAELTDWPNIDRFVKFANPSKKKGAYSNVEWKEIVNEAFAKYLENPSIPMYKHFFEVQEETYRDITPERFANFNTICSMVSSKIEKSEMDDDTKAFDDFVKQYMRGELDEASEKEFEQEINKIIKTYNGLVSRKDSLTDAEKTQLELYENWLNKLEMI